MPDRIVADHAALADVVKAADPERFAEMLAAHLAGVHGMQAR